MLGRGRWWRTSRSGPEAWQCRTMAGVVEGRSNAPCWSVGLCSRLVVFDWVSNAASSWSLMAALFD